MLTLNQKKSINKKAISLANELSNAAANLEKKQKFADENAFFQAEESFWKTFIRVSNRLHVLLDDLCLSRSLADQHQIYATLSELQNVHAIAKDGMLLLCCPHPPGRRNDYFKEYRFILADAISQISPDLILFQKKTLHIVNIYPESALHTAHFLDFDNYDLKSLIDEACKVYPDTDAPSATDMHLQTVFRDDLAPLTYLIVMEQGSGLDPIPLLSDAFGGLPTMGTQSEIAPGTLPENPPS